MTRFHFQCQWWCTCCSVCTMWTSAPFIKPGQLIVGCICEIFSCFTSQYYLYYLPICFYGKALKYCNHCTLTWSILKTVNVSLNSLKMIKSHKIMDDFRMVWRLFGRTGERWKCLQQYLLRLEAVLIVFVFFQQETTVDHIFVLMK